MHWSKKYTQCRNCGTQRFPHKLFGYCARCFHSVKRLEEVRLWNLNQPQTLKGYPRDMIFHNPKTFERVKKGHLKQYKERLEGIRYSEEKLQWPISGHDIEYKIREVAILSVELMGLSCFSEPQTPSIVISTQNKEKFSTRNSIA